MSLLRGAAGLQPPKMNSTCLQSSPCRLPLALSAAQQWPSPNAPSAAALRTPPPRRPLPQPPCRCQAASSGGSQDAEAAPAEAVEEHVRAAAALVANTFFRDEITIGVGSGLGVTYVLEELAARQCTGKLRGVRCVPASDAAAGEAAFLGVPLTTLQEAGRLDFFIQVADELAADAEGSLAFIIGRHQRPAQPQLHRARQLAEAATTNVVIAEGRAVLVPRLRGSLPVEVQEEGWEVAGEELDDVFLGDAELWRRSSEEGAGPRGGDSPYVSAEGHAIIDIRFYEGLKLFGEDADYGSIAAEIDGVEGVVAHGLMANVAAAAVLALPSGPHPAWRKDDLTRLTA